ncbi:restriction endonuclease subunit S [Paenibacillus tritici]|uniref:Restriction endonuclease subunit S n=1 Tax=Paenibacillus tritici TaxID=1873425 RepID=A0ABX2DVH5_9BACL|nr:restriction endonuclease subunit S [Paenibacillus tritici]NQX48380.1 restriction endonuclease subunit S [Paenibacillus tritici]
MKSKWKLTSLPDLLSFVVDNRGKTVPTEEKGHQLIATNCVRNDKLYPVYEKVRYLSDETYKTWFRAHPIPGDILFVNKGTPGRVCMVPDLVDFCIAQDMIAFRTNDRMYNKFLFAVLRSSNIQTQIYNTSVGDVIPHFKKSFLDQLLIPEPDLETQRKIGDMYYLLSKKIDINTKINHQLEQTAQTIFTDFKKRCTSNICTISDIAAINTDTYSGKEGWEYVNYLDTGNISNNEIESIQHFALLDGKLPSRAKRKVRANDIVYSTVRPNQRHFGIIAHPVDNMLVSTGFAVLRSVNPAVCNEYIYLTLTSEAIIEQLQQLAEQSVSTFPSIKALDIGGCKIIVPTLDEGKTIQMQLAPLFHAIYENQVQSTRLAALRDTLLPRLMSGELSVSDLKAVNQD